MSYIAQKKGGEGVNLHETKLCLTKVDYIFFLPDIFVSFIPAPYTCAGVNFFI